MIRRNLYYILLMLVACVLITPTAAFAGPTLTCGGSILDADDLTSADGGIWQVYNPDDCSFYAEGLAGQFTSGYWAGEVGAYLDSFAIGNELICIVEKETGSGTIDHRGYYAVMNHTLTNSDPAQFDECILRVIPVPSVEVIGEDAYLTWNEALEDSLDVNIIGYNVFRSNNGVSFSKINFEPLEFNNYTDIAFPTSALYYAVGLVYQGVPPRDGQSISANSNSIREACLGDFDGDGDVDGSDLATFAADFGRTDCQNPPTCEGNFDGDNDVDGSDLATFAADFGRTDCPE